ncbi:MAG: efflux RND transporter periplasmic adaptor subunit [Marinobacter sp.]|nr:efflux RND transporter periplasmic adaptor subunit [Marinobacter sp.]
MALSGCSDATEIPASPANSNQGLAIAAFDVQPTQLYRVLNLTGEVVPRARIQVAARATGAVEAVTVDEGHRVTAGQILVRIDVSEARAELQKAEAEAALARFNYERASRLRERNVTSDAELESTRAAVQVTESLVRLWQTRAAYGQVLSPVDGVVSRRFVEPGEAVQAQSPVVELVTLDDLQARFMVSERDAVQLQAGQVFAVRLDALPGQVIDAPLLRVAPSTREQSRLVQVDLSLPSGLADQGIGAGYTVRGSARTDVRDDVMAIPTAAIGRAESSAFVMVVDEENRLQRRTVETGVVRGDRTEIVQGLSPGDRILATSPLDMREGQPVRVVRVLQP